MANKLYAMELLTEEVAKDVAANPQEWMRFLNTASRLYRYTFPEQLLIYAQLREQQPWHPWKSGTRRCTDGLKRVLKELP